MITVQTLYLRPKELSHRPHFLMFGGGATPLSLCNVAKCLARPAPLHRSKRQKMRATKKKVKICGLKSGQALRQWHETNGIHTSPISKKQQIWQNGGSVSSNSIHRSRRHNKTAAGGRTACVVVLGQSPSSHLGVKLATYVQRGCSGWLWCEVIHWQVGC